MHGEPSGLIRRRLTPAGTRAHGLGPTVAEPLPEAEFSDAELARVTAGHPANKVIAFGAVADARLVRGATAHGLRPVLRDGTRHKLLWLTRDPASAVLRAALPVALGDRLA